MDKHDTLLISSGSQENRRQLRLALETRYNLLESTNSQQMLMLLKQNIDCVAAMVLDITTPEKIDRELMLREENQQWLRKVPTIIISGNSDDPQILNLAFDYGAADVIPLNYEPYAMLRRIENIVDLHVHKQHLEAMVEEQLSILHRSNETVVDALSSIIEYRSLESGQHILRIRHFTRILLEEVARSCPEYQLTDQTIAIISSASALHDIGKIAIPDAILLKPGKLTEEEREIMKTHSITGCKILDSLHDVGDPEYRRYAHNICHYHHERWDGGGYPEGLSGEDIPICAQVVGLADVYDALTTKRVYKDAFSFGRAVNMILRGDCGVFSPKLLECFKHVTPRFEALAQAYADGLAPDKEKFDVTLPSPVATEAEDSMERVRAKYFALVHYINGLLVEVDLDKGLFHMIYNPYPELAWFQEVATFEEIGNVLSDRAVTAENRQEMMRFFQREVRNFMDADMRRLTRKFRFQSLQRPEGDEFEVTLLRTNPISATRRTLTILCRRIEEDTTLYSNDRKFMVDSTFRCLLDEDFTLIQLGDHIPKLAGYTREELEANFQNQLIRLVHPEDRKKMRHAIRNCLIHSTTGETEYRVFHKDGRILWVRDNFYLRTGADGKEYLDCYLSDITLLKREFDALNEKIRRYELILAQTENALFEWDYVKDTVTFSDTWQSIFGQSAITDGFRAAIANGAYFHPDDLPMLIDKISALENGSHYETIEVRLSTAKGRYLWCRVRASAIRGKAGDLEKVVGIVINIDVEKQAQRLLQDRAERDSLTKLLNKNAARKQAEEYLKRFPNGVHCAMLIIDLDNFKEINDRYGHLFGDAVLTKVARELERSFRNQDIVARIGGDEFMVLMRGIAEKGLLESRCARLLTSIQSLLRHKKNNLSVGCSIGIALAPEDGTTYFELFNRADQALYQAKNQGKNCYTFYEHNGQSYFDVKNRDTKPIESDEEPGLAEGNIVQYAFRKLYGSKDVESAINEILAMIGQKTNVSRVYIFENSDDNRFCSNTYEWCNEGIRPEIQNLQNISYETDIPGYADYFDENGIFYCPDISMVSEGAYEILEPQGIKSMLQCAIRENGVFRGYIGFDECIEQRIWTKQEISLLTFFSETLSMFLLRLRRQEKVQWQADELRSILDNQAAWIYVVRPEDYRLAYVNSKLKEQLPDVNLGVPCYKVMKNREAPCPYCPILTLGENTTARHLKYNAELDCQVLLEATRIRWEGKNGCLMTSRLMPKQLGDQK